MIAQLIDSIHRQTYPGRLIDIYVTADNCTDNTAMVARRAGATVFERFNRQQIGKGYVLSFMYSQITEKYDGYFVFDADNVLDENYISEMNKTFSDGYRIITSYRNSKNFGDNWISAGYSLWFLRESKYLNYSRMLLGTSCAIGGTGFLVCRDILEESGGWDCFLLTEDIEFTARSVLKGEKIGFNKNAVLYDEQPVKFGQAWNQRLRWSKGFLQVFVRYGRDLLKQTVTKRSFSAYDIAMTVAPFLHLMACCFVVGVSLTFGIMEIEWLPTLLMSWAEWLAGSYLFLLFVATFTLITEWNMIYSAPSKKILYLFTFPIFMLTYIPISLTALFKRVEWKPIKHSKVASLSDIKTSA